MYWSGYVEQVRNVVAAWTIRPENRHKNPVQPFRPVDLSDHPFEKMGIDLFEYSGINYFLAVDYYSKWPCVAPLKSLTTSSARWPVGLLAEMDRIIADFGTPSLMISDNGPAKEVPNEQANLVQPAAILSPPRPSLQPTTPAADLDGNPFNGFSSGTISIEPQPDRTTRSGRPYLAPPRQLFRKSFLNALSIAPSFPFHPKFCSS